MDNILETLIKRIESGDQTIQQSELQILRQSFDCVVINTLAGPVYKFKNIQLRIV